MKKNLLAITIAAAAAAPMAAQADASLYGEVGFGVQSVEGAADVELTDASKFGVTGTAQADTLEIGYQLEVGVDLGNATDELSVKKGNISVGGEFGTVVVGRQTNAVADATLDKVDVFVAPYTATANDAVMYHAPKMGAVSVVAGAAVDSSTDSNVDAYGVAATAEVAEGVSLVASYALEKTAADDVDVTSFGGSYAMGPVYAAATFQTVDNGTTSEDSLTVAGAYTAGATTLAGRYMVDQETDAAETAVEVSYAMGESADLYANYAMYNTEAEAAGASNTFKTGLRIKF